MQDIIDAVVGQVGQYVEEPWDMIGSYFDGMHLDRLVRHQIESFNDLVYKQIERTIDMFNPVNIASDQDYDKNAKKHRLEINIEFTHFNLYRPQIHENNGSTKLMFPMNARLRNFTYASAMTIDIRIEIIVRSGPELENTQHYHKVIPKIPIGKLPIMLKSGICVLKQCQHVSDEETGECKYDAGGYFIMHGSEKTVLGQERAAENRVYCFNVSKNNTKWTWCAEIKSVPDYKCISPKQINMMVSNKNNGFGFPIYIQIPRVKIPLPLFVVFRALGIESDIEICEIVLLNLKVNKITLEFLQASIIDSNSTMTQEDALRILTTNVMYSPFNLDKEMGARKKREFALDILKNDLFPHCNTAKQKIYFLGYMANRLINATISNEQDDRDSYINKRIDTTGALLNNLIRNYFNKVVKDMTKQIIREINTGSWKSSDDYASIINSTNIYKMIKSSTIENGLKKALSTGDFGIKNVSSAKVGVAQVLNRLTYISSLSHLRRINTPIDKSGKLIPPRKLHGTTWGYLCPAESPEGGSVGVVKNLSYMTHITTISNSDNIREVILSQIVQLENAKHSQLSNEDAKVFLNGAWIGNAIDAKTLYEDLKDKKTKGIINIYTSIVFNYRMKEIRICTDAGRLTRPLLRINQKTGSFYITKEIIYKLRKSEISWDDLLTDSRVSNAVIEYLDPEEQSFSMIAMKPSDLYTKTDGFNYKYTHCEIHPSTIFGIIASCIPFPEHNQSPRNTYQSAMAKQAMGIYVTNFQKRMDKTAYVMTYPARPLVDTRVMGMIKLDKIPSGCPVIVAIMTHTGYNQEDSVLMNKGSIDRGLFQTTIYHTEKDEDKKINGDEEIRCKPDPTKTKGLKFGNYEKVNAKGVMPENSLVENRDVIIAKVVPINRNDPTKIMKYEDQSRSYRTSEESYVDRNLLERNGEGYQICKVKVRTLRKPVIGDKFSSRHGQKGTLGNIIAECDMPFTYEGIRPDIIINPHAIPSRMTIGQLKETILGLILVELGLFGDGTSFGELNIETIRNELLKIGYECNGNQLLYNGFTGEQMESSIFIGPAFYQRLKHMVNDKQHSRSIGPMVNLTRQPAEGRSRDGGHRFGEMERDSMVAHGASRFTRGRMYDSSDKYQVNICKRCGMIAVVNDKIGIHCCNMCDNRTEFSYVEIPYACKLLFQELQTMNIAPRILTQ